MSWSDYTEAIRSSKTQWNQPVTPQEAVEQQLTKSFEGIKTEVKEITLKK